MPRFVLAIVIAGLMVAGCGPGPQAPDQTQSPRDSDDAPAMAEDPGEQSATGLAESHWRLVSLAGEPVEMAGGSDRAPTMHLLADGALSGFGGCNRYNGEYTLSDGRLSFGPIASTKMACPGVGDVERRFFAALSDTAGYRLEAGELVLTDAQGRDLARLSLGRKSMSDA